MGKLVERLLVWAILVTVIWAAGWQVLAWLDGRRHPVPNAVEQVLSRELGGNLMTSEQRDLLRDAVRRDPVAAVLAVRDAHSDASSAWDALRQSPGRGRTPQAIVQRRAVDAALSGRLDAETAGRFASGACELVEFVAAADPDGEQSLGTAAEGLTSEECRNVAADPSYLLVAPHIDGRYRALLQRHQGVLTQLLSAAAPQDWPALLEAFQAAEPRLNEILADPTQGRTYAVVYMLWREQVEKLVRAGLSERSAIEFVAANALTLGAAQSQPGWPAAVAALAREKVTRGSDGESGASGQGGPATLLDAAAADPAVYAVVTAVGPQARPAALRVLCRYAGTDLPAVLLKYRRRVGALDAAVGAVDRFDHADDADPLRRCAAARVLGAYQDDEAFRGTLAARGPLVVPSVQCGGPDALAAIAGNPNDLYKYVDADGRPRGTPWWTYVPGGMVVYVSNEKWNGRSLTWGEMGWAAVDTVTTGTLVGDLIAIPGEAAAKGGVRALLARAAAREGAEESGEVLLSDAGRATGRTGLRLAGREAAELEAGTLVRLAGGNAAKWLVVAGGKTAWFAAEHPRTTLAASATVCMALHPDRIPQIVAALERLPAKAAGAVGQAIVKGTIDNMQSAAALPPMTRWAFYGWCCGVLALLVLLSLRLLKWLVAPVYVPLAAVVRRVRRRLVPARDGRSRLRPEGEPAGAADREDAHVG